MTPQAEESAGRTFRYALIGCAAGVVGMHMPALQELPAIQLVGMSDINQERGAERAAEAGCQFYTDYRQLLDEVRPEVAVVCTPHPLHAAVAEDCLNAGAHVLLEKPIAVEVAEADRIIATAEANQRLVAVAFQRRYQPVIQRARALIDAGHIGPLVRTLCIQPWYRTAAYYRSASWRGTWRGEGGGVLMNQAPHTIDMLCHLAGMPARLWGWTRTLNHAIECEDTAQAMLEYPNGAPGSIIISTIEAGSLGRLEIVGERGALEIKGGRLTLHRFEPSTREHMASCPEIFQGPQVSSETFELPGEGEGHKAVYEDLNRAIQEGRQPFISAREALMSLEMSNAIILSSHTGQPVSLPLARKAYSDLLAQLQQDAAARR